MTAGKILCCKIRARRNRRGRGEVTRNDAYATVAPLCASAMLLAAPEIARAQDASVVIGAANLPRDLTLWGMYFDADPVVKTVLIGLALASMVTWTVWLTKTVEIAIDKQRVVIGLKQLTDVHSIFEAVERLADTESDVRELVEAAATEQKLSAGSAALDSIKERIASRLERIELASSRRVARGIGVLATIGATAPFVGLFGTVWGIMNSFIGISQARATNLAVVSPGIAEALLATALGLIAAIPAVVIYNLFVRMIAGYRAQLGDAAAEVLRLASRELERAAVSAPGVNAVPSPTTAKEGVRANAAVDVK
jgi:biopolymer transport protein ExbB